LLKGFLQYRSDTAKGVKSICVLKTIREMRLVLSLGAGGGWASHTAEQTRGLLKEAGTIAGRRRGTLCC